MSKQSRDRPIDIPASDRRLLDLSQVCAFLSLSEPSLHRLRNDPEEHFPQPLQMMKGRPLWALVDVNAYVDRKRKEVAKLARA